MRVSVMLRIVTNYGDASVNTTILKVCTATAVVLALASFTGTSAQQKKATKAPAKPAACTTIKDEAACKARSDCSWTPATTKLKITIRRARCVAAAPPAAKKAPEKKK
jgi:hypothetical protein